LEEDLSKNMSRRHAEGGDLVRYFDAGVKAYDEWYDAHPALYGTELAAVKMAMPRGTGAEIGVGTGRFAAPLAVEFGLDLSRNSLNMARRRGVKVVQGDGYALPFKPGSLDFALIVFVLELVENVRGFLAEASGALKEGGALVLGFIDRDRPWGRHFLETSDLRSYVNPPAPVEIAAILGGIGLDVEASFQALFGPPPDLERVEEPRPGFGGGGFVVFKAVKRGHHRSGGPP
jgi:SAM-dependent methyltransferase